MQVEYWINDNEWKQVTYEAYSAFEGEKEMRPSTWRCILLNNLLLPLRYM